MNTHKRIRLVEAARGIAALQVLLFHLVEIHQAGAAGSGVAWLLVPFSFGREAVIVFFVLSGFSIHYASMQRDLATPRGVGVFLLLRALRLYPILIAAVLLTVLLIAAGDALRLPAYQGLWSSHTVHSAFMSLLFLTDLPGTAGAWWSTPPTNPSLWSLSYEVVYYALYPLFWHVARSRGIVAAAAVGVAISALAAALEFALGPSHLLNVMQLYGIWCIGALLAEFYRSARTVALAPQWIIAAPVVLILLRGVFRDVLPVLGSDWLLAAAFCLPCFALLMPAEQLQRQPRRATLGLGLVVVLVAGALFWVTQFDLYHGSLPVLYAKSIVALALVTALVLFVPPRLPLWVAVRLTSRFEPLGGVSYAVYVLHYPLLLAAHSALTTRVGAPLAALLAVLAIVALAWFLERRLQPALGRPLRRRLAAFSTRQNSPA